MARTTFQGPIRSLGGVYTQGANSLYTLTASSITLTPDANAGRPIYVNVATTTITLPTVNANTNPVAAGPGNDPNTLNNLTATYTFIIGTTASAVKIRTTSSTPGDLFIGSTLIFPSAGGAASGFVPNGSSNDVINLNGTTTGGIAGSVLQIYAVAANKYFVTGNLIGSGTLATPFADS
jgi:hypothetical protein